MDLNKNKSEKRTTRESPRDMRKSGIKSKENPAGILRVDIGKPRRASLECGTHLQGGLPSPQPSVDRLSVTFAEDSLKSDASVKCNLFNPYEEQRKMDKVHFPEAAASDGESDDEDYSASVTAIMQRRASTRKSKRRNSRRGSSPFSPDLLPGLDSGRRRSSVYTTSSGDTAISMDESLVAPEVTQEEIFENIKLHKEVLGNVKMQPWNMRKKLRLVIQAKSYIKKHEGVLQERLAQSRSTRDMLARWNIYLVQKWHRWRREMSNLSNWFIPWERKIKEIESHFGSAVASYFTFLRWLFWVNTVIAVVLMAFVAIPELLTADVKTAGYRKVIQDEDRYNATNFLTLWDFEGVFKYSPLFYGWYTNNEESKTGYRLPFAYFVTGLVVYAYSFFAILRKMAENSRMSKLSEKEDEYIFSWKLFTGWDFMIGNAETAHNRVASIVMGFKEALMEEAEKKKEPRKWKIIGARILVNIVVASLLTFSAFAVVMVVKRSTEPEAGSTAWRRNEITVVMSLISFAFPILFEIFGFFEGYHPRKQLRLQLARIMVLNLLNLYSLILASFNKINHMTRELKEMKDNTLSYTTDANKTILTEIATYPPVVLNSPSISFDECYDQCINNLQTIFPPASQIINALSLITLPFLLNTTFTSSTAQSSHTSTEMNEIESTRTTETSIDSSTEPSNVSYFNVTYPDGTNVTFSEGNIMNASMFIDQETLFEITSEFRDAIETFLNYIFENITSENFNSTNYMLNSTESSFYNTTDLNATAMNQTTYDFFKTTMEPLFQTTFEDYDARFETEMSTIYKEIATTLSSYEEEISTSFPENCTSMCTTYDQELTTAVIQARIPIKPIEMDYPKRSRLMSLCWETMFGQELVKLTVMDLIFTVLSTLGMDFFRGIFVRVMNNCWCWDLEKKFPQYGDFKVAENILHLVNNQGMVWMGMFFSPGLVVMNVVKLYIMMYLRSWAVLTCNVPHEVIFRASRSNNFYFALLLMMLFLCVLPVGFAIVWVAPSWHCGPFSNYQRIFHIFTHTITKNSPEYLNMALAYIASPGIVIPLLVLLILIIYYLVSLTSALREANNDLKIQLRRERTEERRKVFQIAERRRVGSSGSGDLANTPFAKWKKLLNEMPPGKSLDDTPNTPQQDSQEIEAGSVKEEQKPNLSKNKDFFSKLIKRALRKSSSEEEDAQNQDEGTDTEQHESLPEDIVSVKEARPQIPKEKKKTPTDAFQNVVSGVLSRKKSDQRPGNLRKESTDSSEAKRVQIKENDSPKGDKEVKREELHRSKQKRRRHSPPKSSGTTKEIRRDSSSSVWSENIPTITISKTESAECILETQEHAEKQAEVSVSSSTKIKLNPHKPKIKYALKKQDAQIDIDSITFGLRELEFTGPGKIEQETERKPDKSKAINRNLQELQEGSSGTNVSAETVKSGTSDSTKTESSTDYKDAAVTSG